MSIRLCRRYRFSASHLYRRPEWSEEENRRRFGKCSNLPGHGHNYRLVVKVSGEVDPETGFLADLAGLDSLVQELVLDPLDHRHINAAVPDFGPGKRIPTSEELLSWIQERLVRALAKPTRLTGLRLEEDDDLAAEWEPEGR